ncbi:hypothetical protein B0H13DRAFT_1953650 [Mycena leptocephala]|nr:hypothetical protein B0H13DRAFT_1953650 [Mycena leptocephala]
MQDAAPAFSPIGTTRSGAQSSPNELGSLALNGVTFGLQIDVPQTSMLAARSATRMRMSGRTRYTLNRDPPPRSPRPHRRSPPRPLHHLRLVLPRLHRPHYLCLAGPPPHRPQSQRPPPRGHRPLPPATSRNSVRKTGLLLVITHGGNTRLLLLLMLVVLSHVGRRIVNSPRTP